MKATTILHICRAMLTGTLVGLLTLNCSNQNEEKILPIGPEVKASLVIYFKSDSTEEQISQFWKNELSKPDPKGRGVLNRDGIRDILSVYPPVQNHEAVAVTFFPNATQAERDEVKRVVLSSPIVYRVLENVSPAEVKKIE